MSRTGRVRRRWAAASVAVAVVGVLMAVSALVPTVTSAAWQDQVYADAEVLVLPAQVPTELDAGAGFTCALVAGDMWCWGEGGDGQLGVGSTADALVPVSAGRGITPMTEGTDEHVYAGNRYACGASGGRAYCWGAGEGKLGNFDVVEPWQVPPAYFPTAVYDLPAGTGNQFRSPLYGQTVREVVAGDAITCAVTELGTAACWGLVVGLTRPPSPDPQSWANAPIPVPTSAQDPLSALPPGVPISFLTSTFQNACFVAGGIAYCWGANTEGQLGLGTVGQPYTAPARVLQGAMPAAPVDSISAGTFHTCAIAAAQVYCWGLRGAGRLGVNDGESGALTSPGHVVGLDTRTMVAVSAGSDSTCALDSSGQAWCWGLNSYGKLGTTAVGNFQTSPTPVAVQQPADVTFTALSVGDDHVCAIADDDNIYCWGRAGALGTGPGQVDARVPVEVTATWATP